jgi:hypothetical protein
MVRNMANSLTIIAILLIALAAYKYYETNQFLNGAKFTTAKVINVEKIDEEEGEEASVLYYYQYTLQFLADSGVSVEFVSDVKDHEPNYQEGDQVEVAYQPSAPSNAKIASFWGLHFPAIIFAVAGIGLLLYSQYR